jgi:hypothetical protein
MPKQTIALARHCSILVPHIGAFSNHQGWVIPDPRYRAFAVSKELRTDRASARTAAGARGHSVAAPITTHGGDATGVVAQTYRIGAQLEIASNWYLGAGSQLSLAIRPASIGRR